MTRRAHVIPRGYQRYFADGEQIRVVTKADRHDKVIGTRDAFVDPRHLTAVVNGVRVDAMEDEFARVENGALPWLRTARYGEVFGVELDHAIKTVAAMLFARSYATEVLRQRIHDEVAVDHRERIGTDRAVNRGFRRSEGRRPEPGELEALSGRAAEFLRETRVEAVNAIGKTHNTALRFFEPMYISVYVPPKGGEFVTSDNPVVLLGAPQSPRVGVHRGVGLASAAAIFVPLTRYVGVCFTHEPEKDQRLTPTALIRVNNYTWINAVYRVACHPSVNWADACGVARVKPSRS